MYNKYHKYYLRSLVLLGAVLGIFLFSPANAWAATRYWVGSSGGSINSTSNWSATANSACAANTGASVPSSADNVIFESDCTNNATIDATMSVNNFTISSGYTGTITQSTGITFTVGASYSQGAGTFTGGNSAISVTGKFILTAGTFTSTSGTITIGGNMTISNGATYNKNNGSIKFAGGTSQTVTDNNTTKQDLGNLTVASSSGGGSSSFGGSTDGTDSTNGTYLFASRITIDHAKVPNSDQTNFPILISSTYSFLKTVANGGYVQNSSGYDIGFFSDSACVTQLSWEKEKYVNTTGEIAYWVKIPTLSHTADTVIYMCYDNSSIVADQSSASSVWDSNFKAVLHLPDGTTLNTNDSTSAANNGTNHSATATTGQIDGAASFDGSSQYVNLANESNFDFNYNQAFTTEAWINPTSFPVTGTKDMSIMGKMINNGTTSRGWDFEVGGNATYYKKLHFYLISDFANNIYQGVQGTTTLSTNTWYHVVATYDGSSTSSGVKFYINGSRESSSADNVNTVGTNTILNNANVNINTRDTDLGQALNSKTDEVRISNVARSADWIATEYNNQSSPSTFYTIVGPTQYLFHRAITIDHSKVSNTDQTNFPVLVSGTYTFLKTTANSGYVQNSSGYDIGFFSDSSCTAKLAWETEKYTASSGVVAYWVKIPTLSYTTDTTFYMCYGSSNISADQSDPTNVWDSNFKGVYHMPDGTTLNTNDSTIGASNGTNHSATATTGQIDGAANFNGSSQYVSLSNESNFDFEYNQPFSAEAWINPSSFPVDGTKDLAIIGKMINNGTTYRGWDFEIGGNAASYKKLHFYMISHFLNEQYQAFHGTATFSTGTWYHVVVTYDGSTNASGFKFYINGSPDAITVDDSNTLGSNTILNNANVNIGTRDTDLAQAFNSKIDEVHISNVNRSADWISTEYNNQSSPSTFYSIGPTQYLFHRAITIDHTKIPNTDQANFPVLVSGTFSYLASVSAGGNIQNASGYDIGFYTDSACTVKMAWEKEKYSASTGEIEYWVKIPTLSHTLDTSFYLCYGNSSITTDISTPTAVWDSNYKGVYHLSDGTTLNTNDSTGVNNGTNHSATATTGVIDGAVNFNGSTYIDLGTTGMPTKGASTIEGWFTTSAPNAGNAGKAIARWKDGNNGYDWLLVVGTDGSGYYATQGEGAATNKIYNVGVGGVSSGVATHIAGVSDGSGNIAIYVNGVATIGSFFSNSDGLGTDSADISLGAGQSGASRVHYYDGTEDEVRISSTVRAADWIVTEYNNQSSPSTFYSIGSESSSGYLHANAITIDHTKVPNTDQTNFPVLISGMYTYLKSAANGGHVQNASGYDVGFFQYSTCTGRYNWETETYTASTGAVNYWVKIPTLSHTADTTLYLCYDNSLITNDLSDKTQVWDSNYNAVYHFDNIDGVVATTPDSTSHAYNGTLNDARIGPVGGWIDNGAKGNNFFGFHISASASVLSSTLTYSMWLKRASSHDGTMIGGDNSGPEFRSRAGGAIELLKQNIASIGISSGTAADDTWTHVAVSYNSSGNYAFYINGSAAGSGTSLQSFTLGNPILMLGALNGDDMDGYIDEVHISNSIRSADWIATEYNNQNSPSSFYSVASESSSGYLHANAITIDHTKVPNTDQTNFPVLISGTFPYLKSAANGGHVQNSSGYDIGFFSNSSCTSKLSWETEKYDATTGQIIDWVKIPTVSHTADTTFYLCYDSIGTIADQSSPSSVWDSNYNAVYHLADGSTLNVNDSTSNAHNGTNNSATATTGEIYGAAAFSGGSTQNITGSAADNLSAVSQFSMEMWYKRPAPSGNAAYLTASIAPATRFLGLEVFNDGDVYFETNNATQWGSFTSNDTSWHHVVGVFDGSLSGNSNRLKIYQDGVLKTLTFGGTIPATTDTVTAGTTEIGSNRTGAFATGSMDEVRISNAARSADWAAAEYNNQSSPSTFYNVASESSTYLHKRLITIDHTKVPNTDQTDFPVLISGTYSYLKTVSNGGTVQNKSGYDIGFFSDSTCLTKMQFETEKYASASGTAAYWVKIPTLSHTTDTTFYLCYDNNGITTNQSAPQNVWDSNYKGVWHLPDGTSLNLNDSTSGGHTGSNNSATAATGKIDGGMALSGSGQYVTVTTSSDFNFSSAFTLSAWAKTTSSGINPIFYKADGATGAPNFGNLYRLFINSGKLDGVMTQSSDSSVIGATGSTTISDGAWHKLDIVFDSSANKIYAYVDGSSDATPVTTSGTQKTAATKLEFGEDLTEDAVNYTDKFNGSLDELKVSSNARSADWIKTEYNNQSNPQSFYSIGPVGQFSHKRSITIDHTKVGTINNTDQTDFPVLVAGTYSYLKTSANGGDVSNSSGYDIGFYSNSDCFNGKLDWETEKYIASTGSASYFVKVPTVSHTSDTVMYLCYGNSAISSDESNATGVWDSNYSLVWHLPNGTTLTGNDSTTHANNYDPGSTTATATAGKIDGGVDSSVGYVQKDSYTDSIYAASFWFKSNSTITSSTVSEVLENGFDINGEFSGLGFGNITSLCTGETIAIWGYTGRTCYSNNIDTNWHELAISWNGSKYLLYLDGELLSTVKDSNNSDASLLNNSGEVYFGNSFDGIIDELRLSTAARSADWVKTEYNNESTPSTFYTVSSEITGGSSSGTTLNLGSSIKIKSVTINSSNTLNANGSNTITIDGSFTNNGTFTPSTGTVVLAPVSTGTSVVGGSTTTTFNNLTATTTGSMIKFKAGQNLNVSGILTLSGGVQGPVHVLSDSTGNQWYLNLTGSSVISFVYITDSGCVNGTNRLFFNDNSSDLGNNDHSCMKFVSRDGGGASTGSQGSSGGGTVMTGGSTGGGSSNNNASSGTVDNGATLPQTFSCADGTALASCNSNWTVVGPTLRTSGNKVYGSNVLNYSLGKWNGGNFNNNQYAEITLSALSPNGKIGVSVRNQNSGANAYWALADSSGTTIQVFVSVSPSTLYTGSAFSNGDVLRLEISGTTLTLKKNGTVITTVSDSTYSTGKPGLAAYGNDTGSSDTSLGDDWTAGSIAVSGGGSGGGGGGSPTISLPFFDWIKNYNWLNFLGY